MPAPQNIPGEVERPTLVLEPKPVLPRTGFYVDMPADIMALNLPCSLYFSMEEGSVKEVGYRVFEDSNVIDFPRWKVEDGRQETALAMFESTVLPHLRKKFNIPGKEIAHVEAETPPHSTDGGGSAPGDESGRKARVSGARRKSKKARVLG